MNALDLVFACGYRGRAVGTSEAPSLSAPVEQVVQTSPSGAGWQLFKKSFTVGVSTSTRIDLLTGLHNVMNESITGPLAFTSVKAVMIEHDADSLSTSGVRVFGGTTAEFQGPRAAVSKDDLLAGEWTAFGKPASATGWTVNSTARNIDVVNLSTFTTQVATVNVFVLGRVTAPL
jgi:hypothetical protein